MTKFAVVAHDAGAANHIIAWIQSDYLKSKDISLCLEGPAADIYTKNVGDFENHSLDDVLLGASMLISGTGWASSLEHQARKLAQQQNIKTIAVIEHWVNYRERFSRDEEEILPDEIWVVDEYAQAIATEIFSASNIVLQSNEFMKKQIREVNLFPETNELNSEKVLFVMEPIRQEWAGELIPGEIQALEFFISHKAYLFADADVDIKIKPHPSDLPNKYDVWLNNSGMSNVSVDTTSSLPELIAWSDTVVGCQTYAMVVALSAGKRVVSALPQVAPPCMLPHKNIVHLRELIN